MAACLLLLAASVVVHFPAVRAGLIPVEDDTRVFYFPLLDVTARSLSQLRLPLWTPDILTGYPLFADGEAGLLYPLHFLVAPWLGPESGLVALQIIHSFLASAFAYALLRTLGMGSLGSIVAGLTFGYSGFAAGQIVHQNVFHAMVWLPLEIALVERAFLSAHGSRYRYAVLAGAIVGIQALAAHIQVTLMSAFALSAFCMYRGLFGPHSPVPGFKAWLDVHAASLARASAVFAIMGVVGAGLSAAQLIPLAELGSQNYRWDGVGARLAGTNSVWPGDLLTLLLPRLHDTASGGFWGPWVKWETVLYVGILPLILSVIGLCGRGGPYRPFFGGLALISLALALGPNAPGSLWGRLHELPGFEVLKSPGRFSLLVSLAVAVLAGYGVDWLMRRSRPRPLIGLPVLLAGLVCVGGTKVALEHGSDALRAPSGDVLSLLQRYVQLRGIPTIVDGLPVTPERVAQLAAEALAPSNPSTAWQLLLVIAAATVIALWLSHRRISGLAACLAIAVISADLGMVAARSHPYGRVADLRAAVPDVLVNDRDRPFRVYTPPATEDKSAQLEPNRLLGTGLEEANGYSSLAPDRHSAYVAAVQQIDGQLMDLWNARYVVRRNRPRLLPSYGGTSFHPERPLFGGAREARTGRGALLPDGGPARVNEVRLISDLQDAGSLADGTPVARIVLDGIDGSERVLTVRAGEHVSDTGIDVPGATPTVKHRRAEVAFQYPRDDPQSQRFGEQLYYARLPVTPPFEVRQARLEPLAPSGSLVVYGLGLFNSATGDVTQARDKAKYQEVYRDEQITIFRNTAAMPRAFLVGSALTLPPGGDALSPMLSGEVDVRKTAILEEPIPAHLAIPSTPARSESDIGSASIQTYSADQVVIGASASQEALLVLTDAYFPGWVARIDGQPAPILRANYLFRAVILPPGSHRVTFSYEPLSVAIGATITLVTAFVVFAVAGLHAYAVLRRPGTYLSIQPGRF